MAKGPGTGKLGVVWLLHAHQPVGERESVLEQACAERYAPTIAALTDHPQVRVGLHVSGPLAEWIGARHPELVEQLRALVQREQVELIGGGLGAPSWAALSPRDREGQIRALRTQLERTYSTRVTGAWVGGWLMGSVPVADLARAGVEWVPWSDPGQRPTASTPVGMLESEGHLLTAIESGLPSTFLAAKPESIARGLGELQQRRADGSRGVALECDLSWLEPGGFARLAETIREAEWIETLTPRQALTRWRAERRTGGVDFGRVGTENTPELLAARVRGVSERCAVLPPSKRLADDARRHLYRAQGDLGPGESGVGRPRLRAALAASAMRAERLCREALGEPVPALEVRTTDLNADGRDEILLQTPALAAVVVPHRGGHIAALDHVRAGCDWLIPCRWESEGHAREAAVDRVLPPDAPAALLAAGDADETDLASGVYIARVADSPDELRVVLARAGTWRREYAGRPIRVEKELRCAAGSDTLEVRYTVTGGGDGHDDALFVSEWNVGLIEPDSEDRWLRSPDGERWGSAGATLDHADVAGIDAVDESRNAALALRADRPVRLATWRVEAHGRYQATGIGLCVPIALGGDAPVTFHVTAQMVAP